MISLWRYGLAATLLVATPRAALADPPAGEDEHSHSRQAAEHARQAREHAVAAIEQHEAEVRAQMQRLREQARAQSDAVREELRDSHSAARQQLIAAGEHLREAVHEGFLAGRAELKTATETLKQELKVVRERAQEARQRAWHYWKARIETRDAIDARMQAEFDKHARREAKLQRIAELAERAGDTRAVRRAQKLRAHEAARHDRRMQQLTARAADTANAPETAAPHEEVQP